MEGIDNSNHRDHSNLFSGGLSNRKIFIMKILLIIMMSLLSLHTLQSQGDVGIDGELWFESNLVLRLIDVDHICTDAGVGCPHAPDELFVRESTFAIITVSEGDSIIVHDENGTLNLYRYLEKRVTYNTQYGLTESSYKVGKVNPFEIIIYTFTHDIYTHVVYVSSYKEGKLNSLIYLNQ